MKSVFKISLCTALVWAATLFGQSPDLILQKDVTDAYNDYLSNLENAFQQQVNLGGDDAATMRAHLGLALIQAYRASASGDTLSARVSPLMEESLFRFYYALDSGYTSLATVLNAQSQAEFFEQLTAFFENGDYPQLRDFVREQFEAIRSNLDQVRAEVDLFLQEMQQYGEQFGEHWDYVYQHTADFTFTMQFIDYDGQATLFVFSRTFFNRLHNIADLGESLGASFDAGFSYLDAVMPFYGADVMPGVADLRRGFQTLRELCDTLEVLVTNQPLAPLGLPIEPFQAIGAFAETADTLLAGAEVPIGPSGENKAIVLLAVLQNMPGNGLTEVIKGFYRGSELDGYTFAGIFPRGLPSSWLTMIRSDLVINVNDDFQTFKTYLNAKATQWQLLNPISPDKHMGIALAQIVNLLSNEDYYGKINQAYAYLSAGRIDSLIYTFEWSDFDLRDEIDAIRFHLQQYYAASPPVNFVILEKEDDVLLNRYEITADSDFEIIFIGQPQARLLEGGIHLAESAATALIEGVNRLYQNLDQLFVLDLDPDKLNFANIESDLDLILILESANPRFLSLTPYGVAQFKAAGEALRQGFYEAKLFSERLERLFVAMAPYEDDFNMNSQEYIRAAMLGKFIAGAIYTDFAYPDSTTIINGERVNLSAWFDNPPASLLQLWKDYVTGVDQRLGGLFPDRPHTAVQPEPQVPLTFNLYPVYPNPFNPTARIAFDLPQEALVKLYIVDLQGRVVERLVNQQLAAGRVTYTWDAARYPSGIYFAILEMNGQQAVRKMTLIK